MKRSRFSSSPACYGLAVALLGMFLIAPAKPALAEGQSPDWHNAPGWHNTLPRKSFDDADRDARLYAAAPPIGAESPPATYYRSSPPPTVVYFPPVPASTPVFNLVLPFHF